MAIKRMNPVWASWYEVAFGLLLFILSPFLVLGTPEHFLTYQQSIFGRFSCKELKKRKKMIPYLFKFVEWFQRYEILKVRIFHFFLLKILNFPPKKWDQLAFFSIIVTIYLQLRVHSNHHYSSSLWPSKSIKCLAWQHNIQYMQNGYHGNAVSMATRVKMKYLPGNYHCNSSS